MSRAEKRRGILIGLEKHRVGLEEELPDLARHGMDERSWRAFCALGSLVWVDAEKDVRLRRPGTARPMLRGRFLGEQLDQLGDAMLAFCFTQTLCGPAGKGIEHEDLLGRELVQARGLPHSPTGEAVGCAVVPDTTEGLSVA